MFCDQMRKDGRSDGGSNWTPVVIRLKNDAAQKNEAGADERLYPYQRHVRRIYESLIESPVNLLVASPTGSGKTFAITEAAAVCSTSGHRLFVAEPLIALAEQVYKQLGGCKNSRVGLRTGPTRRGPEGLAQITVCTYEVLAKICASEPHLLEESFSIILDEIHNIGGDRGTVIQEILEACALVSRRIPLVALSGTLPNAEHFAAFLSSINRLTTLVVGADSRPVPLQFCYYDTSTQKCSLIRRADTYVPRYDESSVGGVSGRQHLLSCIAHLQSIGSLPLLFVAFSCNRLDVMCGWCQSLDFLEAPEKSRVTVLFDALLRRVPVEDRPLFDELKEQSLRGIGRHHSQLPVCYLELVCCLAEARLSKLVFSSSTLSAGINLPVRTVVMCGARIPQKDSVGEMHFETISPMLFHQLAGRAGRPGFEDRGYCVVIGTGTVGYQSAQYLVQRPHPNIAANGALDVGAVLRALRSNRSLGLDRALFANPGLRSEIKEVEKRALELTKHLTLTCDETEYRTTTLLADAIECVLADRALLVHAQAESNQVVQLQCQEDATPFAISTGRDVTDAEASSSKRDALRIDLTVPRRKKGLTIPFEVLDRVLRLRASIEKLTARALAPSSARPLLHEACLLSRQRRIETNTFSGEPLLAVEANILRNEIPKRYLEITEAVGGGVDERMDVKRGAALSELGLAACLLRCFTNPCHVLDALTALGRSEPRCHAAFLSAALGEGKTGAANHCELSKVLEGHGAEIAKVLARLPYITEARLTLAVVAWYDGQTLVEIINRTGCSVGSFSRHVLRVSDAAEECRQAYELLRVEEMILVCDEVQARIKRGLPFAKRTPDAA